MGTLEGEKKSSQIHLFSLCLVLNIQTSVTLCFGEREIRLTEVSDACLRIFCGGLGEDAQSSSSSESCLELLVFLCEKNQI